MDITALKDKFRTSKWRIYFARIGALVIILANDLNLSKVGLVFILIGIVIRLWASGYLEKRRKLATSGPYKFVRNPLYLGSIFIGIGFWIMSSEFLIFLAFFLIFAFMYASTVKREEKDLLGIFGEDYENYLKDVPRFIPSLKNFKKADEYKFSWKVSFRNKEYMVILGVIGMLFAMKAMHDVVYPFILQEGTLPELIKNFVNKFFKI